MTLKFRFLLVLIPIASFFMIGCKKEDDNPPVDVWAESVFIINEGPFQDGTGTIMAYNRSTGEVTGDLFEQANARPLGNVVQSMSVYRDLVWIAVNNSNKIEVVRLADFVSVATIDSINLPRYIVFNGDNAFVSSWDNKIIAIDVNTFEKSDELPAGTGPDEMAISGEFLYAVNSGGLGTWNTVSFVNINNKEIYGEIQVGNRPCGIVTDESGKLWVLCSGNGWNGFPNPDTDTPGGLFCIDPETREIISQYPYQDSGTHPDNLVISEDGSTLFYSFPDGIYRFSADNPALSSTPFIPYTGMFYGLGYDPLTDLIYASDPLDYARNGLIYRYNANDGSLVGSNTAGIVPNGFWFN
jgi:hypothetical protein